MGNSAAWQIGVWRAAPCLPLWGRWQPEGLTEEVFGCRFSEKRSKCGEPLPTSLRSATLPKGEGKGASNANLPECRVIKEFL